MITPTRRDLLQGAGMAALLPHLLTLRDRLPSLAPEQREAAVIEAEQAIEAAQAVKPFTLDDLRIRTKKRELIPFAPNPVQIEYLDELLPNWRDGDYKLGGRREIILKARQFGFSTLIAALFFLDTITTPRTYTVVVAHEADSTERLFQIVKRFYENLPADLRPRTKYANRREFYWPELDSTYFVGTAGASDFGRSATINNAHLSEVAFWPDAEELISGLLQSVPHDGNVFVESTANGLGNWYHDEFQAAHIRHDSAFKSRFYAWFQHHEYRSAEVPVDFEATAEERKLVQAHGLVPAQLEWRRGKKKELRDKFPQEYPGTPQEAFLATGGRVLEEFRAELAPAGHLCPYFAPPLSWRHLLVIDPGWNTTAGLFAAIDPQGMVWLYHEVYEHHKRPDEVMLALNACWEGYGKPKLDVILDPSAFDLKRTRTGEERPSDAAEFLAAAEAQGCAWFVPRMGDCGDPNAYRGKRYFAEDRVRVCQHMRWFQWEAERWIWEPPPTGRQSATRDPRGRPIKKHNHLMAGFRYLMNELPEAEEAEAEPEPLTWEQLIKQHRGTKRRGESGNPMGSEV